MKKLPAYLLLVASTGCPQPPQPQGPTPIVQDTDHCEKAETRLRDMNCLDRRGDPMWVNKNGEPFEETCRIAQEEGRIFLNPKCIASAETCNEAKKCPPSGG